MTIAELFDLESLYFKELFDGIKYPWEVLSALSRFIGVMDKSGFEMISDEVWIGKNVKIHPSAVISGPTVIGDGCEIRSSAFIRGKAVIGEKCVIGNSTEIKNSILMDGVQVPHYNYVGDSILGNKVHLGAGAVCSNLKSDGSNVIIRGRHDVDTGMRKLGSILGDGVEIGCNCVLNPGTVIGKHTTVYPLNSVRGVICRDCIVKTNGVTVHKE